MTHADVEGLSPFSEVGTFRTGRSGVATVSENKCDWLALVKHKGRVVVYIRVAKR